GSHLQPLCFHLGLDECHQARHQKHYDDLDAIDHRCGNFELPGRIQRLLPDAYQHTLTLVRSITSFMCNDSQTGCESSHTDPLSIMAVGANLTYFPFVI